MNQIKHINEQRDGLRYPSIDELAGKSSSKYKLVIAAAKRGKEIDLSRLIIYVEDLYKRTQMYIIYAKYGKQNYLPRLGVKDLLEERSGKKFIDMLLDADSTLTIEKIIDDDVKEETEIAMIIKLRGQKQEKEICTGSLFCCFEFLFLSLEDL